MKRRSRPFYVSAFLTAMLAVAIIIFGSYNSPTANAQSTVRYDDLPDLAEFVVDGRKWDHTNLTYFFQNGTLDINGNDERQAIRDAFALWASVTPLTFTEVSNAGSADIVILWGVGEHGDGFSFDGTNGVLAHAFFPPPNGGSIAGDAHFDDGETWTLSSRSSSSQPIDLVTVAAHEIGHSLGLGHSQVSSALMAPFYTGSHRFLDQDDINGIRFLYPLTPHVVSFSSSNFSVNESNGVATITVNRSGNVLPPVTVDYATADGSAQQRGDYTIALGKLSFGTNETSKTFQVLLTDDGHIESNETVNLTLSNPTGGVSLGNPSSAVLTIASNDSVASQPIDNAQFFVRQHYHDFLNREPDQGGLNFWTNEITSCGSDAQCIEVKRINVSAAFFLSIEFQQTGYLAYRFYNAALNRPNGLPRYLELMRDTQAVGRGIVVGAPGWEAALEANKAAYANEFVSRSEFTALYPTSLTPTQFVDALYAHAVITPSAQERQAAIDEFNNPSGARGRVLRRVADNPDLNERESNRAFVLTEFFGYLRRNPDDPPDNNLDGYNFWVDKLNKFDGNFVDAEMVKAFIMSTEYRQRFGP
ncbi:MAG TPA: matrixin family metalloprotease [Pyrinomonadaceae bacterium]|nr:matrixin family metalloprotease [Pyrinomonadaceae bacterium]